MAKLVEQYETSAILIHRCELRRRGGSGQLDAHCRAALCKFGWRQPVIVIAVDLIEPLQAGFAFNFKLEGATKVSPLTH